MLVKALRLEVEVQPNPRPRPGKTEVGTLRRIRSRVFKFITGEGYWYRLTLRNVGNEAIESDDLETLVLRWQPPIGQANLRQFLFPEKIDVGQSHTFDRVHHDVLGAGYSLLYVDFYGRYGGKPLAEVEIQDPLGQPVAFERQSMERDDRGARVVSSSQWAITNFFALSGTEVNQYVLISVALLALVLNVVFGYLNYVK